MMNKYLSYISLFLLILSLSGCIEEHDIPYLTAGQVEVKLYLNMPGDEDETVTRAGGIDTEVGGLDETTQEQRYVRDVTVLLIQDGRVIQVADDLKIEGVQGSAMRNLTLTADATREAVDAMVVINALENGISASAIKSLLGKTLAEVHNTLIYSYPDDPSGNPLVWNLSSRYLPMWGMTKNLDLSRSDTYGSCDIYRSVAKMSLMVDESCTGFQMEEVYVYYMERKGYLMSGHTPDAAMSKQYMLPDVPETSVQTTLKNSVMYDVSDNGIANRIFVPESDNKTPASSKKQLKIVVGGTWSGEGIEGAGKKNYWRIDMCDELDNPYDIIRNHSYIYNITKVSNPGTPTPDEALESEVATLGVEVKEWNPQYMRSEVPDQYTLTTSKSVITLNGYTDISEHSFDVWTDYEEGWTIETDENGKIIDSSSGEAKPIEWLTINNVNGPCNHTVTVKVNAEKINLGATLTNRFWIKAGNIRKEITVIFPQPPTANSYVVGDSAKDGDYSINVCIKGNGADGTRPEGVDIVLGKEGLSPVEDAALYPHELGIIWETKAGLISLKNPQTGKYVTGSVRVPFNPETNSLDFKTDLNGAEIGSKKGGNALIGAFDDNGVVIWSWHIWVCPEMYDSRTGQIIEEQFLEDWTISGYRFMDRNLGALSNMPLEDNSVASMGLQYQWGRKDPFIGPAYSNDMFTGTGLLPVVHYYEEWGVNGQTTLFPSQLTADNRKIDYTVAHPTQLVYWKHPDGKPTSLISLDNIGMFLWGTDKGFAGKDIKELGTKTIYDPCPVGYRVPPVDAFVFESVYPEFPKPTKNNQTAQTVIAYSDKTATYYDNDYMRWRFVPTHDKPIASAADAQGKDSSLGLFKRFLRLGRYDTDKSGNEVYTADATYKKSELNLVYGFENVFIQWLTRADGGAYTAPIYYEKLTSSTIVDPGEEAQFFRIIKPTSVSQKVSVYDYNFNYNITYIPFNPRKNQGYTRLWDDDNQCYSYVGQFAGDYADDYDPANPNETVNGNALYYGFYLNYGSMDEPKTNDCRDLYILDEVNPPTITWLPLTGSYDPTIGITFKNDEENTIRVETGSSITVNSFMWTNSTVSKSNTPYPGGVALHGGESRGEYYTHYGRHIHGLSKTGVKAERHFTSAVRCVRDVKKVTWDDVNTLTSRVDVSEGGISEITLKSVNGSWKLIDPGAPWLLVTPDKGEADGGTAENNITLKVKTGTAVGSVTTISFQIEGEVSVRKCIVTVTE